MALQTSHHTEPSSTATQSSSSSSSTAGATDPDAQSTAFSPAGSPPLILAFLAIGLFSAAMIVVFGWRRVQFGAHGWRLGHIPTNTLEPIPPPKVLPNKPKLWDLWSDGFDASWTEVAGSRKEGAYDEHLFWENMTPLTANAVPTESNSRPEKNTLPEASPPRYNILDPRRHLFHMRSNSESSPSPGGRELQQLRTIHRQSLKSLDTSPPTPPTSTLQVGFIIIMPSERHPIHVSTNKNINQECKKGQGRKEITDYSIGMYECPWDQ